MPWSVLATEPKAIQQFSPPKQFSNSAPRCQVPSQECQIQGHTEPRCSATSQSVRAGFTVSFSRETCEGVTDSPLPSHPEMNPDKGTHWSRGAISWPVAVKSHPSKRGILLSWWGKETRALSWLLPLRKLKCANAVPKPHRTQGEPCPPKWAAASLYQPARERVRWLPSLTERRSGMVAPQMCPLHCISRGDGRMSVTHEDFITRIQGLLRVLISIAYLGKNWLNRPQGNSFNSYNYCFDFSFTHWVGCEGAWQCSRDQPHPGLQELKDAIHPGENCCGRWLGRSSWCFTERKERLELQMQVRNNKASRSAVKQYHFSPWQCFALWSKPERENVEEKVQDTLINLCLV